MGRPPVTVRDCGCWASGAKVAEVVESCRRKRVRGLVVVSGGFGEAGEDVLVWNPGEGNDLNDGGTGHDTTLFNGNNADEKVVISADGTHVTDGIIWSVDDTKIGSISADGTFHANGYVGGGLQMQTDLAISPSGDIWVMNNWQDIDSCFGVPDEALSTRCGGQGVVVFFGMAKPVRAPQIGPARVP